MYLLLGLLIIAVSLQWCIAQSTAGIEGLIRRRLPSHEGKFSFSITDRPDVTAAFNITERPYDRYEVCNGNNGIIQISGSTSMALAYGLRYYLNTYLNVDIYWFIGSRLHLAPPELPSVNAIHRGASIVPWRYHFNTVTFSYTTAFWTWEDWELQLDWMALHGINLPLAWVGYEKILLEVLLEFGFSQRDITEFFSGPAFQSWNRLGNLQGSWGGDITMAWINGQADLQTKIVARMVELGMTPVLPAFTGFVPSQIGSIFPNAAIVDDNPSQWDVFGRHAKVTFLEPFDPLYSAMQRSFVRKQTEAYGAISHIYTLDQYNENDPSSGDLEYLRNVSKHAIQALKNADPDAVWMMQGWLFYSSQDFWTQERVEAYLGGVENSDMIILDLFSDTAPQWQQTSSYYGKPWIWCQLHDYGGSMGMYGRVESVTNNPIEALNNSTTSMIGMGLTMEGQEGNQIIYDILLDQAWSETPLDSEIYFRTWLQSRYHSSTPPAGIYAAWNMLRQTLYNDTNLRAGEITVSIFQISKSIFELSPDVPGLSSMISIMYDPQALVDAWRSFYGATLEQPGLWNNAAYTFDLTDMTRQVMANAFHPLYVGFVAASNSFLDSYSRSAALQAGNSMINVLLDLDTVLSASGETHFNLAAWIASARAWALPPTNSTTNTSLTTDEAEFYEYQARNQITLWGPNGEISDYGSKQWGGLIRSYYVPRWQMFVEYTLNSTTAVDRQNESLSDALLSFGKEWQQEIWGESLEESYLEPMPGDLQWTIARVVEKWPDVFGSSDL